jgi:hypothetical protein
MIAKVEATQAWLENITYQMNNMVCSLRLLPLPSLFPFVRLGTV